MDLTSLFQNLSLENVLEIRDKIKAYDGAYKQGDNIVIVTDIVRTVRGTFKYTYLDGNPPGFSNFSLYGLDIEEDTNGRSYFMLDGTTPYTLSLLEASYVKTLYEPEFIPSLYYSHERGDFFLLNVDGTEKYIYNIPFKIQYIDNYDDLSYVICYTPPDRDGWCEPITEHQANVLSRIYVSDISPLCPYKID